MIVFPVLTFCRHSHIKSSRITAEQEDAQLSQILGEMEYRNISLEGAFEPSNPAPKESSQSPLQTLTHNYKVQFLKYQKIL